MPRPQTIRAFAAPVVRALTPSVAVAELSIPELKARLRRYGVRPAVDVAKFVAYRGLRYGPLGNGPHQAAAAAWRRTSSMEDVRRTIADEVGKFRASSLAEALFGVDDPSLLPLTEIHPLDKFLPWDGRMPGELVVDDPNLGDDREARVAVETERIVAIMRSFAERGYCPEAFRKGFIRGYFLVRGDDYRFYVKGGRHRVAVLAALGESPVRVRLASHTPRFVDIADVDRWPHVRSGFVSRDLALRVMHSFFA